MATFRNDGDLNFPVSPPLLVVSATPLSKVERASSPLLDAPVKVLRPRGGPGVTIASLWWQTVHGVRPTPPLVMKSRLPRFSWFVKFGKGESGPSTLLLP